MRFVTLIGLTASLVGCAYDPFGHPVFENPGFGLIWIIGGVILAVVWLIDKIHKK